MGEKPMTEAEFEALEKLHEEDMLGYNEHVPLLFDEIALLRCILQRYHELAKLLGMILSWKTIQGTMPDEIWLPREAVRKRAAELLKELTEAKS